MHDFQQKTQPRHIQELPSTEQNPSYGRGVCTCILQFLMLFLPRDGGNCSLSVSAPLCFSHSATQNFYEGALSLQCATFPSQAKKPTGKQSKTTARKPEGRPGRAYFDSASKASAHVGCPHCCEPFEHLKLFHHRFKYLQRSSWQCITNTDSQRKVLLHSSKPKGIRRVQ